MGKIEKQPHGGALYRPAKGETMNRRGRPRKLISKLRETGYAVAEINDCIKVLLSMTEEELADVYGNPEATALEKTIAGAIQKSIEQGNLHALESLLTRAYGKPKETMALVQEEQTRIVLNLAGYDPEGMKDDAGRAM